jgi:ubiquinone/menaquinone biosynthesis C-methylase UbiE
VGPTPRRSRRTIWNPWRGSLAARSFSPLEALAYEALVAPALAGVVVPWLTRSLEGRELLDVGCGGGRVARALATEGRHVVGVDAAASQVRRFNLRASATRSRALVADAHALPFPEGAFDAAYSSCALKHWREPVLALAEMARVTRAGGRICVIDLDGRSDARRFARFAARCPLPGPLRRAYVAYSMRTVVAIAPSAERLRELLGAAGLEEIEVTSLGEEPFVAATATVPARQSAPALAQPLRSVAGT